MGLRDWLGRRDKPGGKDVPELARRLGVPVEQIEGVPIRYREFDIPKRSGGKRHITAPEPELKRIQRLLLRRLLAAVRSHEAATGFEKGYSIVSNAYCHRRKALVIRMDLKEFFPSTRPERVARFFSALGWNRKACKILVKLCTYRDGLPQGAPTSPRLSNLVNRKMDARLTGLAVSLGADYTRYADDITFSFQEAPGKAGVQIPSPQTGQIVRGQVDVIPALIRTTKAIVGEEGYRLHQRKKLQIRRRHQRQIVTGLVVNDGVRLQRTTRRWLRAVEHYAATGRRPTLTPKQLAGWQSFRRMVESQALSADTGLEA